MLYLITYVLSLLDLAATFYLEFKVGQWNTVIPKESIEGNPIGQALLSEPTTAIMYKIVVVGSAIFLLWLNRHNKLAKIATWVVFGIFVALTAYHGVCIGVTHYIINMR